MCVYMYVCVYSDLLSVCWIVQVLLGDRVGHAGWVTTYDVECGTGIHTSLAVPLNLETQMCRT